MNAMTRQEQMDAVFELLPPTPDQRDEREHDLARAFDRIDFELIALRAHRILSSKGKGGTVTLLNALLRLRQAYSALDAKIQPWFSLPYGIDREIRIAKALIDQSADQVHNRTIVYRAATRAAHDLLVRWGYKPMITRYKRWHQLAAILAGDRDLDMFEYLREHQSHPAPLVARVRDAEGRFCEGFD